MFALGNRRYVPIFFAALATVFPVAAGGATTVDELIEKHTKTLTSLGDFRASVLAEIELEKGSNQFKPMAAVDWVRVQNQSRYTSQTFVYLNARQKYIVAEKPKHFDLSFNPKEVRTLKDWDPKGNVELPLLPGGPDAMQFAGIKGAFYPNDPTNPPSNGVLSWLLFNFGVVYDLPAYIRTATNVTLQGNDDQPAILVTLADNVKEEITLSPKHGYLVSRAVRTDGNGKQLSKSEISEFKETSNGFWFPMQSSLTSSASATVRAHVEKAEFGKTIPISEAIVQFPEGARVDQPTEKIVHIWGADGRAAKSFSKFDDFVAWEQEAARANPRGGSPLLSGHSAGSQIVFWGNVVLIAIIAVLLVVRRKYFAT